MKAVAKYFLACVIYRFSMFIVAGICLLALSPAYAKDRDMVLSGLDGDVTTNECESFIDKLSFQPPPATNNLGNIMVYERVGGTTLHGMQTFYSFTKDRRVLDKAIEWSDSYLHGRNDPVTGRILWTGNRELCWPNKATNDAEHVLYSGAENGDVIEHIVATAQLILEDPSLWTQTAPTDTFGFGATYLDRARTYVHECQHSAETTIVPWYVRSSTNGYRLIHPDSPVYYKYCESTGPVPWNQQQCIVGGLLRLAQCHRLLDDGNTNTVYYEKITADAADWFFSNARLVSVHGTNTYDWGYMRVDNPEDHREDSGHSAYDAYVFRAYQANLGPTRIQMQRLVNTALHVMYLDTNRFSGYVNGTISDSRPAREYLNFEWIEMSVLDHRLYERLGNAVLTSHEFYDNVPVEAAILYAKHYWATHAPEPEVTDDAKPPQRNVAMSTSDYIRYRRYLPSIFGLSMCFSELLLTLFKRSGKNAVSKDRNSLRLIWLVVGISIYLGIKAAYRFYWFLFPWPEQVACAGGVLFVIGTILRWYSIIYLGRFFTTNVAIASDHRVIDAGPYRYLRHPSYLGAHIAMLGFALTIGNWLSVLIIMIPSIAVNLWRIHVEEKALLEGLGQPYRNYMQRTKRLIPFIY